MLFHARTAVLGLTGRGLSWNPPCQLAAQLTYLGFGLKVFGNLVESGSLSPEPP